MLIIPDIAKPLNGRNGGFTYKSIVERLGQIMDKIIKNNNYTKEIQDRLLELKAEVSDKDGKVPSANIKYIQQNDEFTAWKQCEQSFDVTKNTWLDLPWFFTENYFYRLILDIIGYFDESSPNYLADPFTQQKEESLSDPIEHGTIKAVSQETKEFEQGPLDEASKTEHMQFALLNALWGNQADLSFSGGARHDHQKTEDLKKDMKEKREHVISDNVDETVKTLNSIQEGSFGLIADNCGQEFVNDLYLAETLTFLNIAKTFTFYVKSQPVFVSDVMEKDVHFTVDQLIQHADPITQEFAERFKQHFDQGRWKITPDPFFTGPLPFHELTSEMNNKLKLHDVVFIKGDANYRRLINDTLWDTKTEFSSIVGYMPTNVVALRTLKSESLIGVAEDTFEKMNKKDSEWRFNGKYGLVQLFNKK
ncbi:hypothetical protein AKO1_012565 [Acrasis kona]|uniref:Sugar phosphate phosphatase n=1 Tax=Acrasis kona TaxID=1008807 RepID=A0AAW2YWH6_9EUKA